MVQHKRKALLILSFVLFPVTLYYFSPVLIIEAAIYGILAGSGVVFLVQFFTALFFGRLFCGWICPGAALQEWSFGVNDKRVNNKYNLIKKIIWLPWIGLIIYFFIKAGGLKEVQFLFQNSNGISVDDPLKFVIYYLVLITFISLSFIFGRRAFCHFGCWMAPFMILGTKISNKFNLPTMHIDVNNKNCISCKQCNKACTMSLDVEEMVKKGNMYNEECVLCGKCIEVCPRNTVTFKFGKRY